MSTARTPGPELALELEVEGVEARSAGGVPRESPQLNASQCRTVEERVSAAFDELDVFDPPSPPDGKAKHHTA
jgi:hypothetical protein